MPERERDIVSARDSHTRNSYLQPTFTSIACQIAWNMHVQEV